MIWVFTYTRNDGAHFGNVLLSWVGDVLLWWFRCCIVGFEVCMLEVMVL